MDQGFIEQHPIAIIGLGAVMPDAHDLQAFWANITSGHDAIRQVPAERWDPADHFDTNRKAPDKSYTKIGAFVRDYTFDCLAYRIPPKVAEAMDDVQKWTVDASRQALESAGYLEREFDRERCAVIFGNALAGEMYVKTTMRVHLPRFHKALLKSPAYQALPETVRQALLSQFSKNAELGLPPITEDSMPGELSNVIAGRVAQAFGLRGPNFTTDAACASSLAALQSAAAGLNEGRYDMVLTGGVDSSMGPQSFVKFSKIGALSPDGSRPFDKGANGFVMGEGCGVLLLKRLADAEQDKDPILAVVRGIGSSSDGRGKGITAPNPIGQGLAVERAYEAAGISPASVGLLEAHGTSTSVGDQVEVRTMAEIFSKAGATAHQVPMGSIKSQIGHLKSAAGAASLIKAVLSLHHRLIPASLHFSDPNPAIAQDDSPFFVPTRTVDWESQTERVAGVSAFGFGGTNFHAILSEYSPDAEPASGSGGEIKTADPIVPHTTEPDKSGERNMLVFGAQNPLELLQDLEAERHTDSAMEAPERLSFSFSNEKERTRRLSLCKKALEKDDPGSWKALSAQGIFRGRGPVGKVAFLFPGQGSQYINMLADLRRSEAVVAETFAEADGIMRPILGRNLSDLIFTEEGPQARAALQDTTVCQPAMLAADLAMSRLLMQRGIAPDLVAGHSLGEYAALVCAGMLSFHDALQAVCARAKEMSGVRVDDPGKMAAVFAPADLLLAQIEKLEGVVPANFNSHNQTVIAGRTDAMNQALKMLDAAGVKAVELPVSHAFHSYIVAPAAEPLKRVLSRLEFRPPRIPVVANLDAQPYHTDPEGLEANIEKLARQVASPVRWVETIERLHSMGARLFVEVGPKRVLASFVADVLEDPQVIACCTNHPKQGDLPSLAAALAACAAAGHPRPAQTPGTVSVSARPAIELNPHVQPELNVVVSGVSMGLPGRKRSVFADDNTEMMLQGFTGIDRLADEQRKDLADQRIVRLVKDAPGGPAFQVIDQPDQVAQLTGRKGHFNLCEEFGLDPERVASYDVTTRLAIGAGLLALRDAGIPLCLHHKTTTTGSKLPLGWKLPEALADETGVIFSSAFPGYDELIKEINERSRFDQLEARIAELRALIEELGPMHAATARIEALMAELGDGYHLDRKFIFRALSMGHTQLAELIGARGPNVQLNAACASTTVALSLANDWIRAGRCSRVLVVGADDITNENLSPWLVGGLLATGAVTTEAELENAALPFDRRRNGMIPGMGAVGLVVEAEQATHERGMRALTRLLGAEVANSAYHGSRLDPTHIVQVMQGLIGRMEREHGLSRERLAAQTVFISHETYTPARGGSASAEVRALRETFGDRADEIVIANTKGFTGHPMGVGIEDAAAVRMLEHRTVPPIANHLELDPDLGPLNLSKGGAQNVRYALRLAAGFGSQVAMTLSERVPGEGDRVVDRTSNQAWLNRVSGFENAGLQVTHKTLRVLSGEKADRAMSTDQVNDPEPAPIHVPAPVTAAPITSAPMVTQVPANDEIQTRVLQIVADKTGYPIDMLEPDLDMEADLGIDTVKQAEMFSEIRESFGIPKQDDLKLSDYPTLAHIVQFAATHLTPAPSASSEPTDETKPVLTAETPLTTEVTGTTASSSEHIQAKVLQIVAEKTGYPIDMLEPDLDMEADLGIDTVKQAEMFSEIRESFGIPKQDDLKLSDYPTLAHIIQFAKSRTNTGESAPDTKMAPMAGTPQAKEEPAPGLAEFLIPKLIGRPPASLCLPTGADLTGRSLVVGGDQGTATALMQSLQELGGSPLHIPDADPQAVAEKAASIATDLGVDGVFVLPPSGAAVLPDEEDDTSWNKALDQRVRLPFLLAKKLEASLANRPGAFFLCATRMGGHLGIEDQPAADPLAGLTSGFVKALAIEWPEVLCKLVDLPTQASASMCAQALTDEARFDPATREVGYTKQARFSAVVETMVEPMSDGQDRSAAWLNMKDPVVLVTGGTGGIASHTAAELARSTGGTYYLVGRLALPEPGSSDAELIALPQEALKLRLVEQLRATQARVTPVMVEKEIHRIARIRSALAAQQLLENTGAKAHHVLADVTDLESMTAVIEAIIERHGRLDAVMHAAGIDHSQALSKKSREDFEKVLAPKAEGLRCLLRATRNAGVKTWVLFGSIAGRFGNQAQTDYAAGNDLLAKSANWLRASRPGCTALTIAYSAWDGAGMATRGSVPAVMQMIGIQPIPLHEGARSVAMAARIGLQGEAVFAASLGELDGGQADNLVDLGALAQRLSDHPERFPLLDRIISWTANDGLHLEVFFDAERDPYLRDHAIDGTPVVPGVMAVECFAEALRLVNPGDGCLSVENLSFDAPLKLYRAEPRRADLYLTPVWNPTGPRFAARMETTRNLTGERRQTVCHYRASLSIAPAQAPIKVELPGGIQNETIGQQAIYQAYFHGPSFQVLAQAHAVADGSMAGTLADGRQQPKLGKPAQMSAQPMLTELAFQTAGLMEARQRDQLGLPAGVERLAFHPAQPGELGSIAAWVVDAGSNAEGRYSAKVVDGRGYVLVELEGYRTSALPGALPDTIRRDLTPHRESP